MSLKGLLPHHSRAFRSWWTGGLGLLPKLNVVGSIPITRSILFLWVGCVNVRNTFLLLRVALADVGRF
jgi:hypothetical protein